MSAPITPLADRVVAVREAAETKTASGLYLPDSSKEKPAFAVVEAVGPDVKTLKKGDVSMIMGIIGTFIGAIVILQNMHSILNIGQPLSYAVIPLAYGVFFKLLTYVAEQRVRNLYL